MTLHLIEGWDYLTATDPSDTILAALGWSGDLFSFATTGSTAFGYGRAMNFQGATNVTNLYRYLRGRHTGQYIFGMRMLVPTEGDEYVILGRDANSTEPSQWQVRFDMFGAIWIYSMNGGNRSLIAKAGNDAFVPGTWFWLEIKVTPSTTVGTFELCINTVPIVSLVNVRMADGNLIAPAVARGISHVEFRLDRLGSDTGWSNDWRVDDMYFLTCNGANNNNYLGNVRAKHMALNGAGSLTQFSRVGAASNWQAASNASMNDSAYVYSSTVGHQDLYTLNPNVNAPTVFGVELAAAYRQDDATQRFAANVIDSAGTQVEGDSHAINQSYTFYYDVYELDPATGLSFTGAAVNALTVGPKVKV